MEKYSIIRHIWRALWPIIVFVGIQAVIGAVILVGIVIYQYVIMAVPADIDAALDAVMEHALLILMGSSLVSLALYIPLWCATRKTHPQLNTGKIRAPVLLLTAGMFIGLNLALVSLIELTSVLDYFPDYEEHMAALVSGGFLLQVVAIGILVPVVEELCFRGVVLNRLSAWMPKWAAVLVSSILFGAIHLNLFQILYATLIGVLLGWAYACTKNLWIPIAGHIAFNLINVLLVRFVEITGVQWNSAIAVMPFAALTVICAIMLHKTASNTDEKSDEREFY